MNQSKIFTRYDNSPYKTPRKNSARRYIKSSHQNETKNKTDLLIEPWEINEELIDVINTKN